MEIINARDLEMMLTNNNSIVRLRNPQSEKYFPGSIFIEGVEYVGESCMVSTGNLKELKFFVTDNGTKRELTRGDTIDVKSPAPRYLNGVLLNNPKVASYQFVN